MDDQSIIDTPSDLEPDLQIKRCEFWLRCAATAFERAKETQDTSAMAQCVRAAAKLMHLLDQRVP